MTRKERQRTHCYDDSWTPKPVASALTQLKCSPVVIFVSCQVARLASAVGSIHLVALSMLFSPLLILQSPVSGSQRLDRGAVAAWTEEEKYRFRWTADPW